MVMAVPVQYACYGVRCMLGITLYGFVVEDSLRHLPDCWDSIVFIVAVSKREGRVQTRSWTVGVLSFLKKSHLYSRLSYKAYPFRSMPKACHSTQYIQIK